MEKAVATATAPTVESDTPASCLPWQLERIPVDLMTDYQSSKSQRRINLGERARRGGEKLAGVQALYQHGTVTKG